MALLSDIDWIIIAIVAVFLLFGRDNAQALRTIGRWYGRAIRLKQELLSELTKAADLPVPLPGAPLSIRGAILGLGTVSEPTGIGPFPTPAYPPSAPLVPVPWTGGYPVASWSTTTAVASVDRGELG